MKAIDLRDTLKPYTKGWIAINTKTNKVVAHADSFKVIAEKIKNIKNILLVPASKDYFGFVTTIHA
jgi:hypothetical protein